MVRFVVAISSSASSTFLIMAFFVSWSSKPTAPKQSGPVEPIPLIPREISRAPAAHGVRYRYIVKHHAELTRLYKEPEDQETKNAIIKKVLDAEEEIATTKRTIYTSAMGRMIMRLTKVTPNTNNATPGFAALAAPKESATASPSRNRSPPLPANHHQWSSQQMTEYYNLFAIRSLNHFFKEELSKELTFQQASRHSAVRS